MANMATAPRPRPWRLRWHPARLLYLLVVPLVIGILYNVFQAVLSDAALTNPPVFAAACVLAVVVAVLGWRLDRRYAALQAEQQREETVAAVVRQVLTEGRVVSASRTVPRDLPPRTPGFVGHEDDLSAIEASLRQGQAVAIVGMGGVGKSSLAAEAVYALAAEPGVFPGGETWVRCDERTGLAGLIWIADQLLATWNAALPAEATARVQTPEDGWELRERALRQRLGVSEGADGESRPAAKLTLLDNVEPGLPLSRLLDTLEPLGVVTLVTTRVEPSSQRVRLLHLEALDAQTGVRLFAERYVARGGVWSAERDEAVAQQIVEALGGLPLAIELAAAHAARTHLPLSTLAEELRAPDALAHLSDPVDPSAGVRYSLRKTLLALTPTQRARFVALGLPEGPEWPLPVIERMLAGAPPVAASAQADLEAMVAYSLVSRVVPQGTQGTQRVQETQGEDTPRVRLHPLVRDLGKVTKVLPVSVYEGTVPGPPRGAKDFCTPT